jgi:hypothetical protein
MDGGMDAPNDMATDAPNDMATDSPVDKTPDTTTNTVDSGGDTGDASGEGG